MSNVQVIARKEEPSISLGPKKESVMQRQMRERREAPMQSQTMLLPGTVPVVPPPKLPTTVGLLTPRRRIVLPPKLSPPADPYDYTKFKNPTPRTPEPEHVQSPRMTPEEQDAEEQYFHDKIAAADKRKKVEKKETPVEINDALISTLVSGGVTAAIKEMSKKIAITNTPEEWREKGPEFESVAVMAALLLERQEKKENAKHDKDYACMITVNVKPGVTFEELEKQVNKYVNRSEKAALECSYHWCYERRWGENSGDHNPGYHCHILQTREGLKPCRLKSNARSTFGGLVGDPMNDRQLNFKWKPYSQYAPALSYIHGQKTQLKIEYHDKDVIWRSQIKIKEYYTKVGQKDKSTEDN